MRNTYQIIILGPGGVGKTKGTNTLLNILQSLGFQTSEIKPWNEAMVTTSSYVIHNFTVPPNYFPGLEEEIKIAIYDMGGQFKYRDMWRMHAEDTDAIVTVVDMTRKTTLKQIPLMLPKGMMEGIPVRLIVNKADLYTDFAAKAEAIAGNIIAIIEQAVSANMVDYGVQYKGEEKFLFNSQIYRYGDQVDVVRHLTTDQFGNVSARMADFEVIAAAGFRTAMPEITLHNAYLFGREFALLIFEILYADEGGKLSDDLIESAHHEAPPFISWGQDPDVFIPVGLLTYDHVLQTVKNMLIDDEDLWAMVEKLQATGFNIDVGDERSWALTSAMIFDAIEGVNYKPMHQAVLPPYFIRKMVEYSQQKDEGDEDFFV
ncbi:MAG: GTPase domain-containing protein [Candidatus Kariarchaeaceae archaeon]|jgi:small GTP-binding protein